MNDIKEIHETFECLVDIKDNNESEAIVLTKKVNDLELELKTDKIVLKQEMPYKELKTDKAKNEAILVDLEDKYKMLNEYKRRRDYAQKESKIAGYKLRHLEITNQTEIAKLQYNIAKITENLAEIKKEVDKDES